MIQHMKSKLSNGKNWINFLALKFKKESYGPKVFCIGYNKTGTTTLGESFELLGYNNSSFNKIVWRKLYKKGNIDAIIKYTSKFESFDDLPWLLEDMIPILDQKFPHSKFVYLEREESEWKNSFLKWRQKIFGNTPDVDLAWGKYKNHEKFVKDYFSGRENKDLITLNVKDPQGMTKLAEFLRKDTDLVSFPHFNKT